MTGSSLARLPWFFLAAAVLLFVWLDRVWLLLQDGGIFRVVGIDWSMYYAQATLLRTGQGDAIYDLARLDPIVQTLRAFTTNAGEPLSVGPVAYPPIFAALMVPFTLPPAPVGFALWTAVNVAGVGYLAWRVAQVLPGIGPVRALLALLVSFPLAMGLIVGQPTALLGCAVAECYLSLRARQDLRAGLWLSVLLLKPQYGVILGPILIWKGRWHAVLGTAIGGAAIALVSLLVVGVPTLLTYGAAFVDIAPWGGAAVSSPGQMINWRALILNLRPSIGPSTGLLLVAVLGILSIVVVVLMWRGPWRPDAVTFPSKMAVTSLVTVLANYHSHVHGLALFSVPIAASVGQPGVGRAARWLVISLALLPSVVIIGVQHWLWRSVIMHEPVDILIWSPLAQILLILSTGALLLSIWRLDQAPAAAAVDNAAMEQREMSPSPSAAMPGSPLGGGADLV